MLDRTWKNMARHINAHWRLYSEKRDFAKNVSETKNWMAKILQYFEQFIAQDSFVLFCFDPIVIFSQSWKNWTKCFLSFPFMSLDFNIFFLSRKSSEAKSGYKRLAGMFASRFCNRKINDFWLQSRKPQKKLTCS